MASSKVWLTPMNSGGPMGHHEGGTRMGSNPKESVVNRYGQNWDVNACAIASRYKKVRAPAWRWALQAGRGRRVRLGHPTVTGHP